MSKADKDTSTADSDLDERDTGVETDEDDTSTEDEDQDDDDQDEDDDEAESDEGDDDDDSEDDDSDDDSDEEDEDDDDSEDEDDDEEEPEFKKGFSNIKGDTPEEYIPNLEDAYRKSSREGKKLAAQLKESQDRIDRISMAVVKDPEFAKKLNEVMGDEKVSPVVDPGVLKARQDYNESAEKALGEFMKEHPALDDRDTFDEFIDHVADIGAAARKKGKLPDPEKAYKKAWSLMDHDESDEELANAAKTTASKPKTRPKKKVKKVTKSKLTDEQIAVGKKMGLTEKQMLENQG